LIVAQQFVAYFRVSTEEQGHSGLGIEAQQEKVRSFLESRGGEVIDEFTVIESGRKSQRPVLAQALEAARKAKAVLVVAKLDRLARDAELVNRLSREVAGNGFPGFLFADLPDVDATNATDRMVLGVMAQVAQLEESREGGRPWRRGSQSSARTKRRSSRSSRGVARFDCSIG
jgi:DNA invertase Pin-like site-specific DNA recombinase